MIIRKIIIDNWRAISHVEHTLVDGWNLLQGPNEAGKSTVVEAIEWALYRDLVGTRIGNQEIKEIIPAHAPDARPVVTLEVDFSDCAVVITKTLDLESPKRDCRLTLKRQGFDDQHFDRTEAQQKLKSLIANDGLSVGKHQTLDAELLISHQGGATQYVKEELSSSVRSTLTLSENGTFAPTSRLQKVAARAEKLRSDELFENLRQLATDSVRRQTVTAQLRTELHTLKQQRDEYARIEENIEELRDSITTLREEIEELKPQATAALRKWEDARLVHTEQLVANQAVSAQQLEYRNIEAERNELRRHSEEAKRLRSEQQKLQRELETISSEHQQALQVQSELERQQQAIAIALEEVQTRWQAARQQMEAWQKYWDVCVTRREMKEVRKQLQELEALGQEVVQLREQLSQMPACATRGQLRSWREQFAELSQQRREAAQQLQIKVVLDQPMTVEYHTDDEVQQQQAEAGIALEFHGGQSVSIVLPGIGRIEASCVGQELRKLIEEIETRTHTLDAELAPFNVQVAQLPHAFEMLEERCTQLETMTKKLQDAKTQLTDETALVGSLENLRQQERESKEAWEAARDTCAPVRHLLPDDVTPQQARAELEPAKAAERQLGQEVEQMRSENDAVLDQHNEQKVLVARSGEQVKALNTAMQQLVQRLEQLAHEKSDEAEQASQLEQLDKALQSAEAKLQETQKKRAELGEQITAEAVAIAEQQKNSLLQQLQEKEAALIALRRDLWNACETDPKTQIDELNAAIEPKEIELERHEARLRGVAILEAALEAERHRLGRLLADPLNELLSPWLTEIRGKETYVEFDDNGERITSIRTMEGQHSISLPFEAHSEGMKEQTALAMRLILAKKSAERLPSGRLPVVLDDPLTQTDGARREGLYQVLNAVSKSLQIIYVTCHESPMENGDDKVIQLGSIPIKSHDLDGRTKTGKGNTNGHRKPNGDVPDADVKTRKVTLRKTAPKPPSTDELSLF